MSSGFRQWEADLADDSSASGSKEVQAGVRPDIYYIILDGYGRADVLKELYGYDNSEFLEFLKARGFYVAEDSHSNYNQTALSLASSMNLKYINYFSETLGVDTKKRFEVAQLIKRNLIRELLGARGYQFVSFETGYERTEIRSADFYWSASSDVVPQVTALWKINAFESLLLESTAFRAVLDMPILSPEALRRIALNPEYEAHRERVLYTFSRLDDVTEMDGNFFVFAHIISPHPPFVFNANGEAITPAKAYRIADGDYYLGPREEYLKGYRDQVLFVNSHLEAVIDRILSQSNPPPIMIIQGDHGPGAYLVWESPEKSNLKERLSILNAYYFPGGDQGWLYPTITPVNTFRIVLDRYFGESYDLLPDESYFSPWLRPYDFTNVTDLISPN
ncbi:MAG TPA: sulfatase-like hydrolase/transferase [Anaerolineales bacterium]|nr:sulfatase-like hydrolase/transferase [Anaerolineales bacterium]